MSNQLISSYDKLITSNVIKLESIPLSPINIMYNPSIDNIQTPINFNSNDNFLKKKRNNQLSFIKESTPLFNKKKIPSFNFNGNINQKYDINSSLIPFPDLINQIQIFDVQNNFNSNYFDFSTIDSNNNIIKEESSINKIVYLDQIKVKSTFLKYFPLISIFKEGKCIAINTLIETKGLFEIIPYNLRKSKEMYFTWSFIPFHFIQKIIEKFNLVELKNEKINNLDDLIIHLFNQLRRSIQSIQVNFLHQKRRELNECLLNKSQDIIITINEISEDVINYLKNNFNNFKGNIFDEEKIYKKEKVKIRKYKRRKQIKNEKPKFKRNNKIQNIKINKNIKKSLTENKNLIKRKKKTQKLNSISKNIELNEESDNSEDDEDFILSKEKKKINKISNIIFKCPICKKTYLNGCALGGHMSRIHPHQSLSYQKKIKTREEREVFREAIYSAKKVLVKKYGMDYDKLINCKSGKIKIKNLIHLYKKEYNEILINIKMEKGINVKENNKNNKKE